ncbi:hypothetical protein LCGC14_1064660 [marine sediment metagenome]|uniref:Uncharacterized protein n=1 Tax=marine sediment metagenome TaxID=412755 RepID=A0A0F9N6Z9_9ZZZZ
MRKIRIDAIEPVIIFEGAQYPAGVWLVTNGFVAEEPGHYVYHEEEKRIEVEAAGVMSTYTAGRLLHNWLVTNGFVAEEPGHYVYREEEKRIEVEAVGVMSTYTADRLLHNWSDTVSEVEPPDEPPDEPLVTTGEGRDGPAKPKRRSKAKAKAGK